MELNDETYSLESVLLWLESQKETPAKSDKSERADILRAANRAIDHRMTCVRLVMRVVPEKQACDIRKLVGKYGWIVKSLHASSETKHLKDSSIQNQTKAAIAACHAYMKWLAADLAEVEDGKVNMNRVEKGLRAPLNDHARAKLADLMKAAEEEAKAKEEARRRIVVAEKEKREVESAHAVAEKVQKMLVPVGHGSTPREAVLDHVSLTEQNLGELIYGINARMAVVMERLKDLQDVEGLRKRNAELEALFGLIREAAPTAAVTPTNGGVPKAAPHLRTVG